MTGEVKCDPQKSTVKPAQETVRSKPKRHVSSWYTVHDTTHVQLEDGERSLRALAAHTGGDGNGRDGRLPITGQPPSGSEKGDGELGCCRRAAVLLEQLRDDGKYLLELQHLIGEME